MADRKVHLTWGYREGVAEPLCGTEGRNLHATTSVGWVNCKRCCRILRRKSAEG